MTYQAHSPPRRVLAAAATVATLAVQGSLLGLFQRQAPSQLLVATPWIEEQLQLCRARRQALDRLQCQQTVARRARVQPDVTVVAQP